MDAEEDAIEEDGCVMEGEGEEGVMEISAG